MDTIRMLEGPPVGSETQVDAGAVAAAVNTGTGVPLHSQLETTLRRLIQQGQISTGAVLPGELELAAQLGVSRHTVRHALGVLTNEGLLRRERGRGTTVVGATPPRVIERSLNTFYAFAWEARARGEVQRSFVLERTVIPADESFAERLAVPGLRGEHRSGAPRGVAHGGQQAVRGLARPGELPQRPAGPQARQAALRGHGGRPGAGRGR